MSQCWYKCPKCNHLYQHDKDKCFHVLFEGLTSIPVKVLNLPLSYKWMRLMGGEFPVKHDEYRDYNQRYKNMFFRDIKGDNTGAFVSRPYNYVRFHAYNPNRPLLVRRWKGVELAAGVFKKYTDDITLNINHPVYKIKLGDVVYMRNWEVLSKS